MDPLRTVCDRLRRTSAVSWRSPAARPALRVIDLVDAGVRGNSERANIPRYSERIRSNGLTSQFGGHRFLADGRVDVTALETLSILTSRSSVLDIGCGVGRLATALAHNSHSGGYVGLDIDLPSIDSCMRNPLYHSRGFHFIHADIGNELYNPSGTLVSTSEILPLASASADLVVAMSLFTHLFADECQHYANEMIRVLRPNGAIVVTAFVLGIDETGDGFPYTVRNTPVLSKAAPRKAMAHDWRAFTSWFGSDAKMLRGSWHGHGTTEAPRSQDWIIAQPAA